MPTIVGISTFISMTNTFECQSKRSSILSISVYEQLKIVGVLTFMSRKNYMLSWVEDEKSFINWGARCFFVP